MLKGVACFRAESQVKKLRSTVWQCFLRWYGKHLLMYDILVSVPAKALSSKYVVEESYKLKHGKLSDLDGPTDFYSDYLNMKRIIA